MKILMVCFGNICRSPLAEGILRTKANKLNLNWQIDSAGTADYHVGKPPHILSQKVALENGIHIGAHKCRQFNKNDMLLFDKIYVMDTNNYLEVKEIAGKLWNENKVKLILSELYLNENKNVPDPWYGDEKDYYAVYELLDKACDAVITSLNK